MIFNQITTEDAVQLMADNISQAATDTKILLLLSGGSNIENAIALLNKIKASKDAITIGMVDERYGDPGHADSNMAKIVKAGLVKNKFSTFKVLEGESFDETTDKYEKRLDETLRTHRFWGLFGMGEDGHTAGILPHSPAVNTQRLVVNYTANDFDRITITPSAISKCEAAYLFAYGPNKRAQLQKLMDTDETIDNQPVQALKLAKELYVFSDQEIRQ